MHIFGNINIGKRVSLGFSVILMLAVLLAAIGIRQLVAVTAATRTMMQQPLTKERMIAEWYGVVGAAVQRTTAIAKSDDLTLGQYFADDEAVAAKHAAQLRKDIEPLLSTTEEKQLYQSIMGQVQIFRSSLAEITKLKAAGHAEQAGRIFQGTYLSSASSYQALIHQLLDLQQKNIDATAHEIDVNGAASIEMLTVIAILVLAIGILFGWWLTAGITRPLRRAVDAARRVAEGDLTGKIVVHSTDETGQLLQSLSDMNRNLLNIVSDVRSGTDSIATASRQIAAGNLDLSSRTEQQAGSLEETASTMEELTSAVRQNADNAHQANQLALSASEVALKGGVVVSQVVDTMNSISTSSKKIVDIIGVIDDIAFQTNILALNAAVEAARAGEQGRGFAVVATEVRNLAQRSAGAAKEIKTLIGDSVEKVDAGARLVDQAGATMGEIEDSVRRVTAIMSEISTASREQNSGIEQINQAIAQMDQVTQQNAALVEQAAAAADSLQNQANNLAQVVKVFKLDGTQANAAAGTPPLRLRLGN